MNYKKYLFTFFIFALSLVDVFAAITRAGIEDAIAHHRLGIYLLNDNAHDMGVQQFIRHCRKHFCAWRDADNDAANGNPINPDEHTVLGNGNWGLGGHSNALRWILNAVTDYEFVAAVGGGMDLRINNLHVRNVNSLTHPADRSLKYVWVGGQLLNRQGENAMNSEIMCRIHLNAAMTAVNFTAGGNGYNGTAGYCYVAN